MDPFSSQVVTSLVQKIIDPILDFLIEPVKRRVSYLVFYKKKVKTLEEKSKVLGDVCGAVQEEVDAGHYNLLKPTKAFIEWQGKVDKIAKEVDEFLEEVKNREYSRCFNVRCPDLKSRFLLGREAEEKTEVVTSLIEKRNNLGLLLRRSPPRDVGLQSTSDYENFGSRESVYQEILTALRDRSVKIVGIYGMGGVGKTKMLGKIREQVEKDKLFDVVTTTVISGTVDVKKIQADLAVCLFLGLSTEQCDMGRAAQLKKELKSGKKILVVLDDVWDKLDMKKIIEIDFGERDFKGCKFLLTSRSRDICIANGCHKSFFIKPLHKEEAWKLFEQKVADSVKDLDILPIAKDVCRECGGLPLIIQVIGAALNGKGKYVWQAAFDHFKNFHPQTISGIDIPEAYARLRWSYDRLAQEEEKSCFLLCSLFREDAEISIADLSRHAMAMEFLEDVDTLEEARNRMISRVATLKTSCLLLEGKNDDTVKMHDVIRDVAIHVASTEKKYAFFVKNGVRKWPKLDQVDGGYKAISLRFKNNYMFPDELQCPKLHTLVLESDICPLQVPVTFFNGLEELKVLNLSRISILSLPNLTSLRMLCLKNCQLEDISTLKELKNLEMLSLGGLGVKELPLELELKLLRLLDLRNCNGLNVIPSCVLSSLSRIEELFFPKWFDKWEAEATDTEIRSNSILVELFSTTWTCLTSLEIHLPNVILLPNDQVCKNLVRFKISIGDPFGNFDDVDGSSNNAIKIAKKDFVELEGWLKILVERAEWVKLERLKGLYKVYNESNEERFVHLKFLSIESIRDMEYINWVSRNHRQLQLRSFSNLSTLKVSQCGFKYLFKESIARCLEQLQRLEIEDCENMEEIIRNESQGDEEEITDPVNFPRLKYLFLDNLPTLTTFGPKMRRSSTTTTESTSTPTQPVFNGMVAFPSLEKLEVDSMGFNSLLVEICQADSFCKLRSLRVLCYEKLSTVVSPNLLLRLQNLETFIVGGWYGVRELFDLKGLNVGEGDVRLLSRLSHLELLYLPELHRLWNKDPHGILSFQSLTRVIIEDCGCLRNLFSCSVAGALPQLEELEILSCQEMIEVVANEEGGEEVSILFPQLKLLRLEKLPNLKSFCSANCDFDLPSLRKVVLRSCPQMQHFIYGRIISSQKKKIMVNLGSDERNKEVRRVWITNLNDCVHQRSSNGNDEVEDTDNDDDYDNDGDYDLNDRRLYDFGRFLLIQRVKNSKRAVRRSS